MSDTDPYAGPTIEEAHKVEEAPVKVAEVVAPVVETPEVPEGSAAVVLAWVGEDKALAQLALDAEKKGQKRTTLSAKLKAIIE